MKATRLSELRHGGSLTNTEVLARLQKLVQCSSMLTDAIRSPGWGEDEIAGLHDRVKDWVSPYMQFFRGTCRINYMLQSRGA